MAVLPELFEQRLNAPVLRLLPLQGQLSGSGRRIFRLRGETRLSCNSQDTSAALGCRPPKPMGTASPGARIWKTHSRRPSRATPSHGVVMGQTSRHSAATPPDVRSRACLAFRFEANALSNT